MEGQHPIEKAFDATKSNAQKAIESNIKAGIEKAS